MINYCEKLELDGKIFIRNILFDNNKSIKHILNHDLLKIDIIVNSFKENDTFVLYTPSLNICSYGETIEDATINFNSSIIAFLKFENNKNRLNETIKILGWITT